MNLRRFQRFPVRLSSVLTDPKFDESVAMTVNLSKQGCLLEIDRQLDTGMPVSVRIDLPGESSPIYIAQATVRWSLVGNVGLGFTKVDPSEQARLDKLLDRVNREDAC